MCRGQVLEHRARVRAAPYSLLPCASACTDTRGIVWAALLPCTRADWRRMYTSYALRPTLSVGTGTWPPSLSWQGGARFHGALRVSLGFAGLWPKRVLCTRPCAGRLACMWRCSERKKKKKRGEAKFRAGISGRPPEIWGRNLWCDFRASHLQKFAGALEERLKLRS